MNRLQVFVQLVHLLNTDVLLLLHGIPVIELLAVVAYNGIGASAVGGQQGVFRLSQQSGLGEMQEMKGVERRLLDPVPSQQPIVPIQDALRIKKFRMQIRPVPVPHHIHISNGLNAGLHHIGSMGAAVIDAVPVGNGEVPLRNMQFLRHKVLLRQDLFKNIHLIFYKIVIQRTLPEIHVILLDQLIGVGVHADKVRTDLPLFPVADQIPVLMPVISHGKSCAAHPDPGRNLLQSLVSDLKAVEIPSVFVQHVHPLVFPEFKIPGLDLLQPVPVDQVGRQVLHHPLIAFPLVENDVVLLLGQGGIDGITHMDRFEGQLDIRLQPVIHEKIQPPVHPAEIVVPPFLLVLIVHVSHEDVPDPDIGKSQLLLHKQNLLLHAAVQK